MSTYTLRLATEATRDLVVEALRAEASKRTRVASGASQHVAADKMQGRDVRSAAVRVAMLLSEAAELGALADELAAAPALPIVAVDPAEGGTIAILEADGTVVEVDPDGTERVTREADDDLDDGLSPAARAAMAQAEEFADEYLADPDGEDVDTQALAEDEPADDDVVEVLP